jgi:hypothetical protein
MSEVQMANEKKRATRDGKRLLTKDERKVEPPELEAEDEAEQAAIDSFPASDPPSYQPAHAGNPTGMPKPKNPGESNGPNQRR